MKLTRISLLCGLVCVLACLSAQSPRDAYRQAYQAWRQTDPDLERDAATAGVALAPRAQRAAAAAHKFGVARAEILHGTADDAAQRLLWLQDTKALPLADLSPAQDLVKAASLSVAKTIDTYASDPDRGIQQLRQSLERERDALTALGASIVESQKAASKTAQAGSVLEQARTAAVERYSQASSGLSRAAGLSDQETSAWASYYQRLPEASQINVQVSTAPVLTPAPPQRATVTPAVPLSRYIGGWALPPANPVFHGVEPQSVDLDVSESNGHVKGTFSARFKVASGDPALRFSFEGDLQSGAIQTFPLVTAEGAQGTIDLIPGPAFNLLEVNFQTDQKPGKIRLGNFILLKK